MRRVTSIGFALVWILFASPILSAQTFFPSAVNGLPQVRFTSNVPGVQVAIDGQPAGTIPLTVWVVPGVHQFTFTAPGEAPKTISYPVESDVDVPYFTKPKSTFPLTINTNAPNAQILLDGVSVAGNPVAVLPGRHTLTVTAPGFQQVVLPFDQPSSPQTLNVTLVPNTFALTVNTNVAGANMTIDGRPLVGNTTSVAPGRHTLTVVAPGYQAISLPFDQPASANVLNVTLVPLPATLTVQTERLLPLGTGFKLFIDGNEVASLVVTLPPGVHTVRIVSGSLSVETSVSLTSGQSTTLIPTVTWERR